eukprot:TRINITY_DN5469_c0_g1_i1.p1 TRINITY_DN5469_c0_g1~~TRINITY_DN5469_c0_g1_i1.p1  ORF type:complete len:435 (-),score=113.98 TRINITY_DN5469_c0_g1_i1:31-1335(-)
MTRWTFRMPELDEPVQYVKIVRLETYDEDSTTMNLAEIAIYACAEESPSTAAQVPMASTQAISGSSGSPDGATGLAATGAATSAAAPSAAASGISATTLLAAGTGSGSSSLTTSAGLGTSGLAHGSTTSALEACAPDFIYYRLIEEVTQSSYLDNPNASPTNLYDFNEDTFIHTLDEPVPWVQIKLADPAYVSSIFLINRLDCCQLRQGRFYVFLSTGDVSSLSYNELLSSPLVKYYVEETSIQNRWTFEIPPLAAPVQYIKIVRLQSYDSTSNAMNLAEILIAGCLQAGTTSTGTTSTGTTSTGTTGTTSTGTSSTGVASTRVATAGLATSAVAPATLAVAATTRGPTPATSLAGAPGSSSATLTTSTGLGTSGAVHDSTSSAPVTTTSFPANPTSAIGPASSASSMTSPDPSAGTAPAGNMSAFSTSVAQPG